jgi:hypothetical protein
MLTSVVKGPLVIVAITIGAHDASTRIGSQQMQARAVNALVIRHSML